MPLKFMKHRWVYGTTQQFCLGCGLTYRFDVHSPKLVKQLTEADDKVGCPTSEEEYQKKIELLKESVKGIPR